MLANNKIIGFVPIKDKAHAKEFYEKTLGLPFVSDDGFAMVFNATGNMLRLVEVPDYQPVQFTIPGWEVNDIGETVAELETDGVEFRKYPWVPEDTSAIWYAP